MFQTTSDRAAAERAVRDGAMRGNWQAAGLALLIERIDNLTDLLEQSGVFAEATETNEGDHK